MPSTVENLKEAFAGESQANRKYLAFAEKAEREGMPNIARLFRTTAEAETMSKDLLSRGFKFVGPTICYAFMQAAGLVNDHLLTCFRYSQV